MDRRHMLAAVVVATSIALLTGCAPGAAAKPTTAVAAPSVAPTPTPAPVSAPTVRVHTTCDELVPPALILQVTGLDLPSVAPARTTSPRSYANERVGALECQWSNGAEAGTADWATVYLTLAPDATRDGFESFVNGEQGSGSTPSSVGPDAYLLKSTGVPNGFFFLTDHYGASAFVGLGSAHQLTSRAAESLLEQVYRMVTALPAPDALWKPAPDLRGATTCDGLATADQLTATVGLPSPREVKSDDGEYSSSLFNVDRQVGGYWCAWGSDSPSTADARVALLPGGASYAPQVKKAGSRDIAGIGDSAFVGADGQLNVIAAEGWLQVGSTGATDDQLVALARVVLTNNGYSQG